ncbi:MAG: PilZ domain-containing protein [Myxococcota bacterium]
MTQPTLDVEVGPRHRTPVPCELEAMDDHHARVRVPVEDALPEQAAVDLWMTNRQHGHAIILPAFTGWPTIEGSTQVCDLFFANPHALGEHPPPEGDRRSAIRVSPGGSEAIEVWLTSDRADSAEPIAASVVDVSVGGLLIEMKAGHEPTTPFTQAEFQILLPGDSWPLVLNGQVRHRTRVTRETVRYGVEFDRRRSPAFTEQMTRMAEYVEARRKAFARHTPIPEWLASRAP